MNFLSSGTHLAKHATVRLAHKLALIFGLVLIFGAIPDLALGATHGAVIFKNPLGPSLSPKAHVGDTITTAIRVRNFDSFGDTLTFTNIVDVVHHGLGDLTNGNLLAAPLTLTNLNDLKDLVDTYTVLPTDPDSLLDDARAGGIDNHDGPSGSHVPQSFLITFPGQIQVLRPAIAVTRRCQAGSDPLGAVTYVGSVSNGGNASLSGVLVSNVVNGDFAYVFGPTNLATNQVITFTNTYQPNPSSPMQTNALVAWGTDELALTVSNSTPANVLPTVSFLAPTNGANVQALTDLVLTPSVADSDGTVVKVDFFVGSNLIGSSTSSPFSLVWSNVPVGSYALVAKATDNQCGAAISPLVNVTVNPAGPPSFHFESAAYTVGEGGGSVTLRVVRNFSGFATVNYATGSGSATEGVDYLAAAGQLQFQSGDSAQTFAVTIREDTVVEGNETFTAALSLPSAGALTDPSVATVTIVDNDVQTGNSYLSLLPPPLVDVNSLGSLRVYLTNDAGLGQWRLPWERTWRASGTAATGLLPGQYDIQFKPLSGYLVPPLATLLVRSAQETRSTNGYAKLVSTPPGSLTTFIDPSEVANNPDGNCRGQWQRDGEGAVWHNSGETMGGLPPDNYLIHFRALQNNCGWGTPSDRYATVLPGTSNTVKAAYYWNVAGASAPEALDFDGEINNSYSTGLPYAINGQLVTDYGEASGFVVKERVVLTAAHVVFDDYSLTWVANVRWLFQRHPQNYNPAPQTVRGYYVNGGYAAQRQTESPGVSSSASFDLDVAALYFYEPAGRGGYGGYLVSESPVPQWLQTNAQKVLIGYPVEGILDANRGMMHAIRPRTISFSQTTNAVFATTQVRSFPGNSGGPLCVLQPNGFYYPAGVYLGGSGNAIVRAIDSRAVDLINSAELTANVGTNNLGGGAIRIAPFLAAGGFCDGYLTVTLQPAAASQVGAAWRIAPRYTAYGTLTSWTNSSDPKLALQNGAFEIEFRSAAGFLSPVPPDLSIPCDLQSNLVFTYQQLLPRVDLLDGSHLVLSGVTGTTYRVEYSSTLGSTNPWTSLTNITFPANNGTGVISNALHGAASNRFLRAVKVP